MKRAFIIIALAISNFAAWLLLAVASPMMLFIHDMAGTRLNSALFMALIMIYFGSVYILIVFLPLSSVMVLIGLLLRRQSLTDCVVGGFLVGLVFHLFFMIMLGTEDSYVFASGTPIGVISGWICWRIAVSRQTPHSSHAIDAA